MYDDDDGNNDDRGEGLILTKTMMKTPTVMTPWSVKTSVFDITTNLWLNAFLAEKERCVKLKMMTKATTMTARHQPRSFTALPDPTILCPAQPDLTQLDPMSV